MITELSFCVTVTPMQLRVNSPLVQWRNKLNGFYSTASVTLFYQDKAAYYERGQVKLLLHRAFLTSLTSCTASNNAAFSGALRQSNIPFVKIKKVLERPKTRVLCPLSKKVMSTLFHHMATNYVFAHNAMKRTCCTSERTLLGFSWHYKYFWAEQTLVPKREITQ